MEIDVIVAWSLALVPVLVLTAVFIWLDVFKLVTFWETVLLLLLGGIVASITYPISGAFLDTLPIGFNNYSRFVAPWLEEALKTIVVISLFQFNRIGLKLDAVIMGFAVGAGFSVVENIFYLLRFEDLPPSVWMVRGLGTAIMHGTTLAILAAIAHQLAERSMHASAREYHFSPLWFVPGFFAAVAIHTAFNQFPREPILAMLGTIILAPLSLLAIFRFGTREAEQWLNEEETAHEALVDTLHAGSFPDDPGWRRVAALAERSAPRTQAMIREYVTILTELVLTEELALLHKSADAAVAQIGIEAKFDRLAELKQTLGKTTLSAVTSLLPFTRADYWELWELHRHLKGGKHSGGAVLDSTTLP